MILCVSIQKLMLTLKFFFKYEKEQIKLLFRILFLISLDEIRKEEVINRTTEAIFQGQSNRIQSLTEDISSSSKVGTTSLATRTI